MADLFSRRLLKVNATKVLSTEDNFSGMDIQTFRLENSARVLFYLDLTAVTGTVTLTVNNSPDPKHNFKEIYTNTFSTTGIFTVNLTDVHRYFSITVETSVGGSASYKLSCISAEASSSNLVEDLLGDILDASTGASGNGKNIFDSASIAGTTTSTVVSYTVPIGKIFALKLAEAGGENIASYTVRLNSVAIARARTWFNGSMTEDMEFPDGLAAVAGDVIDIYVDNFRPTVADFEGRLYGVEVDAP